MGRRGKKRKTSSNGEKRNWEAIRNKGTNGKSNMAGRERREQEGGSKEEKKSDRRQGYEINEGKKRFDG